VGDHALDDLGELLDEAGQLAGDVLDEVGEVGGRRDAGARLGLFVGSRRAADALCGRLRLHADGGRLGGRLGGDRLDGVGLELETKDGRGGREGESHGFLKLVVRVDGDIVALVVLVNQLEAGRWVEGIRRTLVDAAVGDGVGGGSEAADFVAGVDLHDEHRGGLSRDVGHVNRRHCWFEPSWGLC